MLYITEFNEKTKTIFQLMRWLKRNKGIKYIVRNNKRDYMVVRKLVKVRGNSFAGTCEYVEGEVWTILHSKDTVNFTDNGFVILTKENEVIDYKFFKEQEYSEEYQEICHMSQLEAKSNFINNEKITGDMLIKLCKSYKIKVPSQTKYWAKKCLLTIKINDDGENTECEFKGNHESTTVHKVAKQLYNQIKSEV